MKTDLLEKICRLATHLDSVGMTSEADYLDIILKKYALNLPDNEEDCNSYPGAKWYGDPNAGGRGCRPQPPSEMTADDVVRHSGGNMTDQQAQDVVDSMEDAAGGLAGSMRRQRRSQSPVIAAIAEEFDSLDHFRASTNINYAGDQRSFNSPSGNDTWTGALGDPDAPAWVKAQYRKYEESDVRAFKASLGPGGRAISDVDPMDIYNYYIANAQFAETKDAVENAERESQWFSSSYSKSRNRGQLLAVLREIGRELYMQKSACCERDETQPCCKDN